jgi:MFS family permease
MNIARAVQGLGGALLLTASMAIIGHEFTGAERAGAFAFWGASLGIALAVGPIVGGAITNFVGWRWVFFVNVPACAGLLFATFKLVAESKSPDAKSLDFAGVISFSAGLGLLIWALIEGNEEGWGSGVEVWGLLHFGRPVPESKCRLRAIFSQGSTRAPVRQCAGLAGEL